MRSVLALAAALGLLVALPAPAPATVADVVPRDVVPASAAGTATNPLAPFTAGRRLSTAHAETPFLAADGGGFLAAWTDRADGSQRVLVSRWEPRHGRWAVPTVLRRAALPATGPAVDTLRVVGNGNVAAVAWRLATPTGGTRIEVAVRASSASPWGAPAVLTAGRRTLTGWQLSLEDGPLAVVADTWGRDLPAIGLENNIRAWIWQGGTRWSATDLATSTWDEWSFRGAVSTSDGRLVAFWAGAPVWTTRRVMWSLWSRASGWSSPQILTDPGDSCDAGWIGASGTRVLATWTCQARRGVLVADLVDGSWSPAQEVVAAGTRLWSLTLTMSGGRAAVVYRAGPGRYAAQPRPIWVVRSDAAGTWGEPSMLTTAASASNDSATMVGSDVVALWRDPVTARVTAAVQHADGTTVPPRVLSSPGVLWSHVLAEQGEYGVAAWNVRAAGQVRLEAVTWTPEFGWSRRVVLSTAPRPLPWTMLVPTVAVARQAVAVGWAHPSGTVVSTALMVPPQPRGPVSVQRSGLTLTCRAPAFSPTPRALSYRWFAGRVAITGATHRGLVVTPALRGMPLRCRVTALTPGLDPSVRWSSDVRAP